MKIKFLKFLWLLFIVPVVGGMVSDENNLKRPYSLSEVEIEGQEPNSKKAKVDNKKYGVVRYSLDDCPNLINVVKQIFGVDISSKEDAEFLIMNVFRFAKRIRDDSTNIEGKYRSTNFIICDGQAYLNGGTNVSRLFDNFPLYDAKGNLLKQYKVTQLSDIFKLDTKKLEAVRNVKNIYPKLKEWLCVYELDAIKCFWNKIINERDDQRILDILQDDQKKSCKDVDNSGDKLLMTSKYMRSLHTLGVDTTLLICNKEGLSESFEKSRDSVREQFDKFLEKFKEYITELKPEDGKLFENKLFKIRSLETKDYLEAVQDLWLNSEYRKYTHAEYLVQYQRKQNGIEKTPFYMISLLDPCTDFCEEMLTENTSGYKTIVISGCKFHGSRGFNVNQKRKNLEFVNRDVLLIQLDSDSYWKEKFELWRPCMEKKIETINRLRPKREELI